MYAEVKEYIEKADKLAKGVVQKENLPEVKEIREKCLHAIEYIQSQLQQENSKYKPFHAAYGGVLMEIGAIKYAKQYHVKRISQWFNVPRQLQLRLTWVFFLLSSIDNLYTAWDDSAFCSP